MKKRLFLLIAALAAMGVSAQDFDFRSVAPNGQVLWYKINPDNESVTLVPYSEEWPHYPSESMMPAGNLTIPDTVRYEGNAYAVTAMRGEALGGVIALHIPATMVDFIGSSGSAQSQITVDPDNPVYDSRNNCNAIIHTATNRLVKGCSSTIIPNGIVAIKDHAFAGNEALTSITIPPSVRNIEGRAFYSCPNLTSVTFQGDASSELIIGNDVFGSQRLTELHIPAHVFGIGAAAFTNCNLEHITVDEENPFFDSRDNCNAIIESNTNILKVGSKNTVIPTSVTKISSDAYIGDPGETNAHIVIPDWITGIHPSPHGYYGPLFAAQSIADITIPAGWQNIHLEVVMMFQKIIFLDSTPPVLTNWGGHVAAGEFSDDRQIIVPCGSLAAWQSNPGWSNFTNIRELDAPQISVTATEHGSARVVTQPSCGNDTATVSATAEDERWHFSHWSDGSTQNPYTLVLNGDSTLTAYFSIDSANVTASAANPRMGSVVGGGNAPVNGTITLTAVPSGNNIFLCWSNGVTDNPYTLTATTDTVLSAMFTVQDTLILHDTVYINHYIHDTTFVNNYVHDTLIQYVNQYIHDTTFVNNYVHDTLIQYVNHYVHDTVFVNNYVHDTVRITTQLIDTTIVNLNRFDTVVMNVYDTTIINNFQYDTMIFNTYIYDTVYVSARYYDTIFVHDTVYITEEGIGDIETLNAKVYFNRGQIVVEGSDGNTVTLYDVTGRVLATKQDYYAPLRFDAPATGTYMIKIGKFPARKVVVVR